MGKVTLKASVHLQERKRTESKGTGKKSAEGAEGGKIKQTFKNSLELLLDDQNNCGKYTNISHFPYTYMSIPSVPDPSPCMCSFFHLLCLSYSLSISSLAAQDLPIFSHRLHLK